MAVCGVLQLWLIPAVVWSIAFPYIQIGLLCLAIKYWNSHSLIKYSSILIALICLTEIGFGLYSKTNLRQEGSESVTEIKIMTYNLLFKNPDPAKSAALIKETDPDILFVQELTPQWSTLIDQVVGERYPYKIAQPLNGYHGIAIYSKYEIDNQVLLNTQSGKPFAICGDLRLGNHTIQLINVHLSSPGGAVEHPRQFIPLYAENYAIRTGQIKELNRLTDDTAYTAQILAGDLNTLQCEPIYKQLRLHWVDTGERVFRWSRFNFPNSSRLMPIMTLDYIMGRGSLRLQDSEVIREGSSDHFPVITTLQIGSN